MPARSAAPTPYELREQRRLARERFLRVRKAEVQYRRRLFSVANHIDHIVRVIDDPNEIINLLTEWANIIAPWARAVSARMIAEVAQRDLKAWNELGRDMGRSLAKEIRGANTGQALRGYLAEQVSLITSLPIQAAERVHKMTLQGITEGTRSPEIAAKILETGRVTKARARLIARTEVARTASALVQVRSQFVGSESYIWRTSLDADVRPSHRKMEGKPIRWDTPPTLSDGTVTHAGQIYNCRCWPEPVLPDA